ncbi:helix-turn-helix domain-containing protein [Bacillus sp. ISL-57]|uniref:helix-turn-helix domain-containing protein n=1 Tax=Bacillus sp. ISL-57 TaxID=2819135 RepID=UPI001BEA9824|nr:helix-turn-helix transcriptional regulator [Bacillus sp. ISL-57]MBT2718802.1 helix-turn-helix transcriptional regulator [Bacillus sp. ISL-57]
MSLVHRIKILCDEKKVTFAEVERKVGLSNGQIRRWDSSSPKIENIQKVADFFDVSTDYLIGRKQPDEDPEVKSLARDIKNLEPTQKDFLKDLIKTMQDKGKKALDE